MGTHLRVKTSVSTEKAPEMSDASTQMKLVRKETSVQTVGCNECPDPSPGEKVSTCKRCAQVDDLLHQVAELQGTVKRLCGMRGAETEIEKWFQDHAPVADTTENELAQSSVGRDSM